MFYITNTLETSLIKKRDENLYGIINDDLNIVTIQSTFKNARFGFQRISFYPVSIS